jgi:mediator of RNA polymerase II transcription subunit 17
MSKERPTQVIGTLDNQLRQLVGIGTIGSTKLHEPFNAEQKQQDNAVISTGSKLLAINKTSNMLFAAASRLQKESTVESTYWQDVLDVSERGWPVARLPSDPSTLAVKFGFSETTIPEFQTNSWAAMRRAEDGSVTLDTGRLASEPKRVVVSLEKDGKVFGRSSLPTLIPNDAPIEERVRELRNTIMAQELWHELNREARTLLAYNVRLQPESVVYSLDDHTTVTFSLVTLSDEPDAGKEPESRTGDAYAETICVGLYLLLSYAHRQAARKRSQLLPVSADQGNTTKPPYHLIKPIIGYLQHELWLRSTIRFLANLTSILRSAGIQTARYTLQEHAFPLVPLEEASEQLLTLILARLGYRIELTITPQARLEIIGVGGVVMNQATSGFFRIALLPPVRAQPDITSHPLYHLYPPAESYPNPKDAFRYLRQATVRILAKHFEGLANEWVAKAREQGIICPSTWITSIKGDAICDRETERLGVRFELVQPRSGDSAGTDSTDKSEIYPLVSELRVESLESNPEGVPAAPSWSWKYNDISEPTHWAYKTTLEDAVRSVLMKTGSVTASQNAPDT